MAGPKISICIPCYNQGAYLEESIRSCLSQSDDNLEIIVSNNASTDITASQSDDRDPFFEPAQDKIYRHPTFYDLPDEVKHM